MENKILKLENHRQHLTIPLIDGNALVIPAQYIEEIIDGTKNFKNVDNKTHILIRTIVKEWYENVKNNQNN